MSERRLHQMNRCSPVERVRGVGVPEPVRAHVSGNPGPQAGFPDVTRERSNCFPRTGGEHWRVEARCAPQRGELAPHAGRQENDARAPPFAVDEDLPGVAAGLKVAPAQPAGLGSRSPCDRDPSRLVNHDRLPVTGRAETLFNQERQDAAHHLGRNAVFFVKSFAH